ncbi:AEX-3 domain-containing protein [Emericellopsis atlantica]|uniref:AEX-3 domain-containing protein n=1 Tax=Emericellopsis atlantica TaxID=2614577 RepID=A0A9P7ZTH7_9HYPO|nr:AEX-3 domain-containing protein [Emericellopsis atlantica]KAG9257390.1 AEX-3 domain-containing protein [Emericellopsis atlantica]
MHPLKRRFEPVLLDRYPPKDATSELGRRGKFPDYVPMFAFPNDIQIVSSDDRPRSTWHGFTMTSDDNSKLYGITIIIWMAVNASVAEEIELKCEQWRQSHMSNEERELAASLGVRLAGERTHLSHLLAKLPTLPSGAPARDRLEDEISTVEEKISMMTDMLRPLRHGAASKIEGLTAGETGLWTPRAYGVLGRDPATIPFWKEWLKAIVVPMTDGGVLRVPPTSPRVGKWQPLERYVINLCTEAFSPLASKTQVEMSIRELKLYARREAHNEIPGTRTVDLYALFRCLSIENIMTLYEFAMSESRIIFLSSHTSMLHLACHAIASLLYPIKWASIFIPVLPARLISALDAPCPYIVGVERRYEKIELPDDDYVLVDLDNDTIDATSQPVRLPRPIRRKLHSLLQVAAPHKLRCGVATGPPPYAMESFPYDAFSTENGSLFTPKAVPGTLGKWVAQSSSTFGAPDPTVELLPPVFNAFAVAPTDSAKSDRPGTSKSSKTSPQSSVSPVSMNFPPMPTTPISRSDSGYALAATLREKRSGHFRDEKGRRSSSFGFEHPPMPPPQHRPSLPFLNGHQTNMSISSISAESMSSLGGGGGGSGGGGYAPSTYAQSTIAASTIMPQMQVQPVHNTDTTIWVEGHCFNWTAKSTASCTICTDKAEEDGIYICSGCNATSHGRCLGVVSVVCPEAFLQDRVRAAFVRCQASLFYTYRKYLGRPNKQQKTNGQLFAFDMDGFIKSLPYDQQEYATMLRETQGFNEFIHDRETKPATEPTIRLFDEVIMAKKARGRPGIAAGLSRLSTIRQSAGASANASGFLAPSRGGKPANYLSDTTEHIWRTASVPMPKGSFPGDYHAIITRTPARLDRTLMREPRAAQGVQRPEQRGGIRGVLRKQVPSMIGTTPPS